MVVTVQFFVFIINIYINLVINITVIERQTERKEKEKSPLRGCHYPNVIVSGRTLHISTNP